MKKVLKVVALTLIGLSILLVAAIVFINLPSTKKRAGNYLITYLKEQYGLRLEADEFNYEFEKGLLKIRMNNVRIYGGKTNAELFFQTKFLEAEIPYSSLRGNHFLVTKLVLNTPDVNPKNLPNLQRQQQESKSARTFEIRQIDITGGALRYERLPLKDVDLVARMKDNNIQISKLNAKFDTISIEGSGEVKNIADPHYEFHYSATGDVSSLQKVVASIPPLKGEFKAEGKVTGGTGVYVVEGKAESPRLTAFGESPFPVRGTYRFDSASADPLTYKVQWESAPASLVRRFEPEVPEIASNTAGTFEFQGGENFWQGTGAFDVRLDSAKARGIPLDGQITGELRNGLIQLSRSTLSTGSTQTTFEGQLSTTQMVLDVNANVKNPASLAFLIPELRKVPGSYIIRSRIQGPYRNLLVQWDLKGTAPEVQLVSTGSYKMASKQIQASFRGQADVKALARLYPADLQGNLAFEGKASGNIASPVLTAAVHGTDLNVNGTQIGEATLDLRSDGRVLNAEAQIPDYSTTARGSYHFATRNFELQGHSDQLDLATVRPFLPANVQEAEGTFTATFDASGNARRWKDSEAHVTLEQANFKYREFDVALENATADLRDRTATVDIDALTSHGTVQAQGTIPVFRPGEMNLDVKGQTDMKFLSLVQPTVQAEGPVTIDVHLGGTFNKPDYSGSAAAENFSVRYPDPPFELTKGNMVAEFSGSEVALRGSGSLNGSPLTVDGRVPLANRAGFVHLTLDNFSIASLATEADVKGLVSVDMDAHGIGRNLESWSGFFKIVPNQLVVSGHRIEAPEPLEVEMTSGKMVFNKVHLKSGEFLDAEAQGEYNFRTGQIKGNVHNQMDLSLLSSFMTNTAAEGKLTADVQIAGTLKNPDMQGEIQVQNGIFRKFESPILLEQIRLRAPLHKDGIRIETLTARMGGGTVEGSGEIRLENWKPKTVDLRVAARNVGMNYPDSLRSQLNADLTMVNQGTDFLVSGKVQVIRSIYREDIDPRDRLVNSLISEKTALSSRTAAAQGRIRLDVAVETLEDFQMRNNMGKIQAGANLQVRGLLEEPRLFGRLRVRERSEIYFEGNRFEVRRGFIDFYGQRRFNPTFDVELFTIATDADTRQDYEITIPLSGELHDLDRRDPFSFPPLASNQIYFLLLTGRAGAQLGTAGSRFFTQQLASFAAGQVFSDLTRGLAKGFGLDRVEIQPEMISSETDPGAKLVLGKDFTSDFSLLYSISLTDSQDQTWIANYKAPKNLSFRFVDQEDSYTANMRHLIRFGAGVSTGKLRSPRSRKTTIQKIEIENDSLLTNEEILGELGLEEGDAYDFWTVQDELEKLEETLQDRGILFSFTQSEEMALGSNQLGLKVKVYGKERREMTFQGWEVSGGQMDELRRFWREGFSPEGVTEIIRENLLRDLWRKGYHKAEVRKEQAEQNGVIVHRFIVQPGVLYKETQIKFLQAEQYPADELEEDLRELYPDREQMISDAVHNYRSIDRKIVALYVKRGFLDASTESGSLQLTPDLAIKEIKVLEGKPSRIVDIVVSEGQELPEELLRRLKLKEGMVHDPGALLEDEVTIGDFYERLGYRKVQVESSIEKKDSGLGVHYDLKKGGVATIESIDIEGAQLTKPKLILKRAQMKEGEILNQDKIATAQKNLTDLRIFHQVTIRDIPSEEDPNRYRIVIEVIERNHYELTYGFRYDTETDLGGEVQITDLNLFGTGQSVSLYTRIHQQDQLYRLVYHSPTLSGLRWKTLISTSYERGNLLLLLDNDRFDGEKYDFTIQRQINLPNDFLLIPGYQFEHLTLTPLENSNIEPVEGLKVSRLIGTLFRDSRDDPFNAKRGTFFSIDAQVAGGWLSDVSYVKSFNQYLKFLPYKRFIWASSVRVGLATDLPPRVVTERFFAGGGFTLRGFKRDQVGPKFPDGTPVGGEALFILNQELRFPIWKWFGGTLFYDGGNVYSGLGDFNPFDIRHSIGLGLRVNSPFGIARLDYGINVSPEDDEPRGVMHFAIGQAF